MKFIVIVLSFILVGQVMAGQNSQSSNRVPKIWNIRYDNLTFFGRDDFLKNLHLAFEKELGKTQQIAIVGLPGTGKTQTAKQYARVYKSSYDIVWWFHHSDDLGDQFLHLAKALNLKYSKDNKGILISSGNTSETVDQVKDFLRSTSQNWLLIFDDVSDSAKIENFIPDHHTHSRAHIIITSKNAKDWDSYMHLDKFPRTTSLEMIQSISDDIDEESTSQLAEMLDDYPILISHAAHTIKALSLNARRFLKMLKTNSYNFEVIPLAEQTLKFTLDNIFQTSNTAYQLLLFSATLSHENIPGELLEKWFLNKGLGNAYDFTVCMNLLSKNFLLTKSSVTSDQIEQDYDLFSMHDIVQKVLLKRVEKKQLQEKIKEAVVALGDLLDKRGKQGLSPKFSYIFPQILHLSSLCEIEHVHEEKLLNLQLEVLYHYQINERNYIKMEEYAKLFFHSFDPFKGACKTESCARFNTALSGLRWWQGRHREGIKYQLKSLDYYKKYKPGSNEHIRGLIYLSTHYSFIAAMKEAEEAVSEAQFLMQHIPKDEGIFYACNCALLHQAFATILSLKGDHEMAIQELNKSLEHLEPVKKQFNDPKKRLATYIHYVIHLHELMAYADKTGTERELEKLLALYQDSITALNSKQHRLSGILLALIGNCLNKQGKTEEAERYLNSSLSILNAWFRETPHRLQAQAHVILGEIYASSNESVKALNEYFLAESIYKKAYQLQQVDDVSKLYENIILTGLQLKDGLLVRRYTQLHQTTFGDNHARTNKIKTLLMKWGNESGLRDVAE